MKLLITEHCEKRWFHDQLCQGLNNFFSKTVDKFKIPTFQIIHLITLMIHSENHSNILKIILVLQI